MSDQNRFDVDEGGALRFAISESEMIIPSGVQKIAKGAICDSPHTGRIYIPASVEEIDEHAVGFFNDLREIEADPANGRYKIIDGCLVDALTQTLLLSIGGRVPSDINVKRIGECAFSTAENLTEVEISSTITDINVGALRRRKLTKISVAAGNAVYHSANNCIIETAAKKLVAFLPSARIPFDGSVTSVGDGAYLYGGDDAEIIFPPSITEIDEEKVFSRARVSIFVSEQCNVIRRTIYREEWNPYTKAPTKRIYYGSPDIKIKYYQAVTDEAGSEDGK